MPKEAPHQGCRASRERCHRTKRRREHHGKGDQTTKSREVPHGKAQTHSKAAREHSETKHARSIREEVKFVRIEGRLKACLPIPRCIVPLRQRAGVCPPFDRTSPTYRNRREGFVRAVLEGRKRTFSPPNLIRSVWPRAPDPNGGGCRPYHPAARGNRDNREGGEGACSEARNRLNPQDGPPSETVEKFLSLRKRAEVVSLRKQGAKVEANSNLLLSSRSLA
jgi:hypothetical protein